MDNCKHYSSQCHVCHVKKKRKKKPIKTICRKCILILSSVSHWYIMALLNKSYKSCFISTHGFKGRINHLYLKTFLNVESCQLFIATLHCYFPLLSFPLFSVHWHQTATGPVTNQTVSNKDRAGHILLSHLVWLVCFIKKKLV